MNRDLLRSRSGSLEEARAWCRDLAQTHYENFPVASRLFSREKSDALCSIYAFARTADDFSDEAVYEGRRLRLLERWRVLLRDCVRKDISHPVFLALGGTIRRHRLPVRLFEDLLKAFRQDVTVRRYPTFAGILRYCRYSANPIGRLYLNLFGIRTPRLLRMSDSICTALQLANFWQDIPSDLRRGRLYLPQADLKRFGYREQDLRDRACTDSFRALMKFQVERTRALFRRGRPLLFEVKGRLSLELKWIWNGGMAVLEKIENDPCRIFNGRPTLGKLDKAVIIWKGLRMKP